MDSFALAYREQQQLFVFDRAYLSDTLFQTGGLSIFSSRFLVQFFGNPFVAATLTVLLLLLSSYLLWSIIRRSSRDWRSLILSLAPACLVAASISDGSMQFSFLTSIVLTELFLLIYKNIHSNALLWGLLIAIFAYFALGPAAILFALGAALIYIKCHKARPALALLFPLAALVCASAAYLLAFVPSAGEALTPSFYYRLDAEMPLLHALPWLLTAAVLAFGLLCKRTNAIVCSLCLLLSLAGAKVLDNKLTSKAELARYRLEYYTVNERWDDLLDECRKMPWSPAVANYLNLAFARQGTLTDNLLKFDNRGTSSLLMIPQAQSVDVRVAHIMLAMGNLSAAQNVSYNALFTVEGLAPAMLKINVLCELARGSYEVADKYLRLLEASLFYSKWARSMRPFLWNDAAIESDPLLGTLRRDLPLEDGFVMTDNPFEELLRIVDSNPSDKGAMQYALSFYLLSRDIAGLQAFVDRFWGAPALRSLPLPVQEALIFYSEYSRNFSAVEPVPLEWCLSHGVTDSTIRRFRSFQQASVNSRNTKPVGYNGTYWNYLVNMQK